MPDHQYLKTVTLGAPEAPQGAIHLADYDLAWPAQFAAERGRIARALAGQYITIEHVGSTSVPASAPSPSWTSCCWSMTPPANLLICRHWKPLATACACANPTGTHTACAGASHPA